MDCLIKLDYTAPNYSTEDKITLTDRAGAEVFATIRVGNADIKTLNLKSGWNLASLLVDKTLSYIPEGFFPSQGVEDIEILGDFFVIFIYIDGEWEVYNKNEKKLFELKPQMGFWIKMNSENSITFEGDNYATNISSLSNGWHLLGTGKQLSNIQESFGFKKVWSYKNSSWIKNPEKIEAGQGFWLQK